MIAMGTANRARHRLQWCAGILSSKAATEACTHEFGAGAPMATQHPTCERPLSGEAGGGQHRILETRDRIFTEGCGGVSASPEHNAAAARYRLTGYGLMYLEQKSRPSARATGASRDRHGRYAALPCGSRFRREAASHRPQGQCASKRVDAISGTHSRLPCRRRGVVAEEQEAPL